MGCHELVNTLKFNGRDELVSRDILPEITQRLEFMQTVGLGYLQLGRGAPTLSGGESQRIRLASQLGSNLRGVLYVLDEPTIGLHPRDNVNLLKTLNRLRDKGNSLLVVEHDEETLAQADSVVDLGPGAGSQGGELVVQGGFEEIRKNLVSRTAFCLREPLKHPLRGQRRPATAKNTEWLELKGATANNLNGIDLKLPVGRLIGISGISGAGKSSLMRGSLLPAVKKALGKSGSQETARKLSRRKKRGSAALAQNNGKKTWKSLKGTDLLETVYEVDQSPIGKTSRSTPATYLKIFDEIRALFAGVPLSRMRGYTASRFSFNTEGGRCETCKGNGMLKLEMNFLPTTWVECPDCHGARYNEATLEVEFDGKTIGDVMQMTIAEAAGFFDAHPKINRTLDLLNRTGLGYLQLGQPSPTLSGGEAQRIKLVAQLARGANRSANARLRQNKTPKSTLYLLEEPTIGLHMDDVRRLIDVLHQLVEEGNTLVVIEHNLDVLAECDYLVDIGPEAGENGGKIVARGKPETVAKSKTSRTAPFLREKLGMEP
jgi:excinuclease ABC subunit A